MTVPKACSSEPCASTSAATRPRLSSEKYSAGPNFSASSPRMGANNAMSSVAMVPAMNELMAAVESATPARPCRAIW